MYQISESDKQVLFRIDGTDSVTRLTMLKPETIEALSKAHISIIEDLARYEPFWLMGIDGVPDDEINKLDKIYHFIFDDAFSNLHG